MASVTRRYEKEEFARRGDALYEEVVRPHLKPKDNGRFVALDIDSGEFEIDDDELTACDRLRARRPESQTWLVRVGSRYTHRFGGRMRRTES
jgi:hypothetical protein